MKVRHIVVAAALAILTATPAMAETFLINITTGPDNPTEAAVLDALTLPHLYASGLVQLQIGGALLALVHVA